MRDPEFRRLRFAGEFTKNPAVIRERLADVLKKTFNGHPIAMMFLDNSGVGGNAGAILAGLLNLGHKNVMGINFGDQALNSQFYVLRRDEMWGEMKDWRAPPAERLTATKNSHPICRNPFSSKTCSSG